MNFQRFLQVSILFLFLFFVGTIHAQVSAESLLVQIQELQKQVLELQKQISQLQTVTFFFDQNLSVGMRTESVKNLQQVLTNEGIYTGPISGYFGLLSKAAVIKFQEKYADEILKPLELSRGTGFFGPATRKKLNAILAGAVKIGLKVDGKKIITVPQGSPVTLSWNAKNVDPGEVAPCEAQAHTFVNNQRAPLDSIWFSWIGKQPASGSVDLLAYVDRDQIIFSLTCILAEGGEAIDTVEVNTSRPGTGNLVVRTVINGKDNGVEVDRRTLPQIGSSLAVKWSISGGISPVSCNISDYNNVILAKGLSPSGSYAITNPGSSQGYYVNCIDGEGHYNFDGVEIIP